MASESTTIREVLTLKKHSAVIAIFIALLLRWYFKMGNTPGKPATTNEVLALSELPEISLDEATLNLSHDDLQAQLAAFGVDADQEEGKESLQAALRRVAHPNFWRTNPKLHPNARRVKNWLWVHERYRSMLNDLLETEETIQTQKLFDKWCKKLASHSNFEDEQLFKFFLDHKGDTMKASLNALKQQHGEANGEEEKVNNAISSGEWKDTLKAYVKSMLDHMELEEQTIVGPWLNLSDSEYHTYRTYLSFKYAAMY